MNKTIKKITAFILTLSMVLAYIPAQVLYANYQSLVSNMSINNVSGDVVIGWNQPTISTRTDSGATDGSVMHTPTGYNIYGRNATARGTYAILQNIPSVAGTTKYDTTISQTLQSNSLYSFYVDPYHYHHTAATPPVEYPAPKDTGTIVEALNMTEIIVSTESVNGGFKVTWGNPTFDGANVFNGYRLYYTQQNSATAVHIPETSPYKDMYLSDPNAVFNRDGTITYTFETPNIKVGQIYSLKIEPLYEGSPIRLSKTTPNVMINGKQYQMSFLDPATYEFRVNGAYVKPTLYIKQEGTDNIRLYWNPISTTSGSVSTVEIYSYPNDDENSEIKIGTLAGSSAGNIHNWLLPAPNVLTSYKIVITFDDGTPPTVMESNKVYYDPAFSDFDPYKPIIYDAQTNQTVKPPTITIYWQAFLRKAYTQAEKENSSTKYNLYNDKDVSYKIWVTDDLNNLSNNYFAPNYILDEEASYFPSSDIKIPGTDDETLAYNTTFSTYYSFENDISTLKNLEGNKIYYIKIVATRDGTMQQSDPEFYSIYLPPTGDVDVNPLTMDTPPLRVAKDENGAYIVTDKTMDIEWDTVWFEVYDENTDMWYSAVGKNGDNIIFGKDALKIENPDNILELYTPFDTTMSVADAKVIVNKFLGKDIPIRKMDITKSNFEIFTVEYNYLEKQGGYEQYYKSIKDSELWHTIKPNVKNNVLTYRVDTEEAPTVGPLIPNTAYVVYMRNYTIGSNGERIYAYNPAYVVSNTIDTPSDIDITPTAQVIEAVSSTDTSVTYRWLYTEGFTYTFKFSSKPSDYSAGGTVINHDTLMKDGKLVTEGDKTYLYYTVNNLFPNTVFYAWINAKGLSQTSPWSSPASIATKDLAVPDVPHGLGPMGLENVKIINQSQSTKYKPIDEHSIIIEWTRLYDDVSTPKTGITPDDKGYGEEILMDALIKEAYGVKFNNLDANTKYYFRVKSRLTAVRNADNSAKLSYTYVISMADNEEFLDAIEFEVPFLGAVDDNGIKTIVKESEWSSSVSLITGKSDDEYDGDFDPDLYPVPDTDYEIVYDEATGELTYVFRGPGLDSTGTPNNGADQRFISKVINNKIYDFSIDLTKYNGIDVPKRKVVIPYSVIKALESQKVTLTVKTGNMYTKIDLGIFGDAAKANNVSNFNKNAKAEIYFSDLTNMNGLLTSGQSYVSTPQNINITLNTGDRIINVDNMQKPINVAMAIDNRYINQDSNVKAYKQIHGNNVVWTPVTANYNVATNKFAFDTRNTGNFTVISKPMPTNTEAGTVSGNEAEGAMYSVNNELNITDMPYFNPSNLITANQFNNIVWAVVNDKTAVTMNKTLDQNAYTELGRGKLLVSGTYVTREKGIASLVRLYELKTKQSIKPVTTLANQGYSDYGSVSGDYQSSVNKAIDIGMINGSTIRPKDNMTFGEFMYMLEAVILDK